MIKYDNLFDNMLYIKVLLHGILNNKFQIIKYSNL